jgi:hypothetical protein
MVPSLVAALSLGFAAVPFQSKPAPARLEWQHDWKSACERAIETKRPILVFLLNDSEPICQKTLDAIVADAEGMKRLANFVLVVASPSQHELVEKEIDGKRPDLRALPRHPARARALEATLREKFLDPATGGEIVPQFAFDGRRAVVKHAYAMKRDGFLEFLNAALAGGGGAAAPAEANRSPAVLKIIEDVVDAKSDDEREKAARVLFADSSPERESALQEILARLKRPADQGVVVRAAGAPYAKAWAPSIAKLLADNDHSSATAAAAGEARNHIAATRPRVAGREGRGT